MNLLRKVFAVAVFVFASATVADAQIKIGAVLSVTGPASFLGDPEKRTLEIYAAEINKQGGINGQKLEVVIYDDGGDPNQLGNRVVSVLERLVGVRQQG